jgi:hypothetical protein
MAQHSSSIQFNIIRTGQIEVWIKTAVQIKGIDNEQISA